MFDFSKYDTISCFNRRKNTSKDLLIENLDIGGVS